MTALRLRDAGDSAVLLELESRIDPHVNARVAGIAAALRSAAPAGVRDVLSTYRTVAVHFDPLVIPQDAVAGALLSAAGHPAEPREGPVVEISVTYGGESGPDLREVAARSGLSEDAVMRRHMDPIYRVFMLGFLPGFPYLGTVDPAIATPRRDRPRLRVAAGSVGIAGAQTGVYPCDSPGGWQIIGRTTLVLFDADREAPARLAPGDRVKFVAAPAPATGATPHTGRAVRRESHAPLETAAHVTVVQPGLFTTVQDEGRWGFQHLGVPVSGAMDVTSHRAANTLLGNDRSAAGLEVTLTGPDLRLERELTLAIAGADLGATLDGSAVRPGSVATGRAGSVLRFAGRRAGGRAYVAFAGGLQLPPVLGSRSTHVRTALGGCGGRALRPGDRLAVGAPQGAVARQASAVRPFSGGTRLRVMRGPQDEWFPEKAFDVLVSSRFAVTPQSDRMGYRLDGPPLVRRDGAEMLSDATFPGAIQVPPSGQPILLMADRQTTGGYPQIAVVITADLPAAGQLVPGDWVEFTVCSRADALQALAEQRREYERRD